VEQKQIIIKTNIMTKQQLIDNATAKNFRVEFSKDQFDNELIGINKGKYNYHWFKVYSSDIVSFHHTYSQINGKTKKGLIHAIRVETTLGFYN
jgi:hypothetical protein